MSTKEHFFTSYVSLVLGADERVEMTGKISRYAFIGHYVVAAILLIIGLNAYFYGERFVIAALFIVLYAVLTIFSTELAVTDKKVIAKFGVIRRDAIELRLEKVESIAVLQGVLGRIFNFGTIKVNGAGTTARIPCISNPFEFKKKVEECIQNQKS